MTVSRELGARIAASSIAANGKLAAIHQSRFIALAGAGLLSGNISDPKQLPQLLDENHVLKDPEKFTQFYNRCAAQEMAAVVFAFSIVEKALYDVLTFIFEHDPTSLDSLLAEKQVPLADVCSKEVAEVREQVFAKYLLEFDYLSIGKKVQKLLGILKPATTTNVVPGFAFTVETLDEISKRRDIFVHHADISHFAKADEQIESDLEYLSKSATFFFELLAQRVHSSV